MCDSGKNDNAEIINCFINLTVVFSIIHFFLIHGFYLSITVIYIESQITSIGFYHM